MRRFLAWASAVVLACDLAVVAVRLAQPGAQNRVAEGAGPSAVATRTPGPAAGQARVSGRAVSVAVDAEQAGTIPSPLTVEAPRGAGGAEITDALVAGRRVTITWDAGRPLDLAGDAGTGLDPGPVHLEIEGGVLTVALDGQTRSLLPGTYRTTAPVAYGSAGLAVPSDGLTFVADGRTAITTRGGAVVRLAPRPLDLAGPGRLSARGEFVITTPAGTRWAETLVFGPGPFLARLRPASGGLNLEATLQGPVAAT